VALKRPPDFATALCNTAFEMKGRGNLPALSLPHHHAVPRKHFASALIPLLLCETPPILFW
jgi:hypothetical protein